MKFYEYGNNELPVIVLIHGGGNSKWMFERHATILKNDYRVVLPELDGHGDERNNAYISTVDEAKKIVAFIDENYNGKVYAVIGASLGAQIAMEVLAQKGDMIQKAFLESGIYFPKNSYKKMMAHQWVINLMSKMYDWKWIMKESCKSYGWPLEFVDKITEDAKALSIYSNMNLYQTYLFYTMPEQIIGLKTEIMFLYGSKEKAMVKNDAKKAHSLVTGSYLEILQGYNHCGLIFCNPEGYVEKLKMFLSEPKQFTK